MTFEDAVKIHFRGLFLLLNFVCCWVINGELQLKYELCLFLYLGRTITCCTAQFPSICFAHLLFLHWFVIFPGLCMQFCLSCCFSEALFDFFPHHFSFGKTHSESSGGSFFFPFTNRTHLLFLFYHFYKHHLNLLTGSASGSRRFHVLFLLHSRPQLVWMGSAVRRLCVAYVLLPPFHMLCAPDSLHWLIILCTDVLHVSWSSWKLRGCVFEMWCIHAG